MRVLHLFDWYLPSTLSWVSRLLVHLPDTEVWVGAPWVVHNAFYQEGFRYLEFPLQRYFFPKPDSEWAHPFWQRLLARSQRFLPSYPMWLEHQLRSDPPDILHAHFGPTGCLYLPLARKLDRPLVVTFYGFDYRKLLHHRPVFRRKYQALFAGAARVLAASPTGCEALETLGCPADKLGIVRPSPDLAYFPFVKRSKPPGRLRLVQVATFTEKKGHLTALEAFRRALPQCPGLSLTMAGEPYDKTVFRAVQDFVQQHRLDHAVTLRGPVEHRQMAAFLAGFDAFIHPSCTASDGDHEATPVVLLEAQATGLPVLATRHFDLPDEVAHDYSGWLAPERDPAALAEGIRYFYAMHTPEYQRFSQQARTWVERGFTVEQSATRLKTVYDALM